MKTYSLWLMPGGAAYRRLRGIILRLSRKYSAPAFKPHVTLLGRIVGPRREVLAKSAQLARSMRPLDIRLGSIEGLDEYYRCLFVRAAKTAPLISANRAARGIFHLQDRPPYLPHLSLMYGDFAPDLKEQIIRKLGTHLQLEFKDRHLHVYSTTGRPHTWRHVKAHRLG